MAWLEDWAKRIPIEIDSTKIDEDLTDFPVLVTVTGSEVFDALAVPGGLDAYDVLFLDSRGDDSILGSSIRYDASSATYGPNILTVSGIKCVYSDGANDLLYVDDSDAYDLGVEDFTLEVWINPTTLNSARRVISHGFLETQNGSWTFGIGTHSMWGTGVRMNFAVRYNNTIYDLNSNEITSYITVNTWNHVAVVRSAGTLFFYLNGVQRGSVSCNYDLTQAGVCNLYLSYRYTGSSFTEIFFGYLTKWRLSKGIARYLSTFTPPTEYVNDSYTKFLYMADGGDISPINQVINTYGSMNLIKSSTPFNRNASWDFGTATDDFLRIEDNASFDLGTNDFTIDGWAYKKSGAAAQERGIINKRTSVGYKWVFISVDSSERLRAYTGTTGVSPWGIDFTGPTIPLNTWFHFAFVRSGNTFSLYFNGIKTNTGTMSGSVFNDTTHLYIGQGDNAGGGDWYGYIYGLRLSRGIARYSDNFTPGDPLEFNSSFINRKKIAITDANNNQLYTEIERWDHANKKAYLWTKVPTVVSSTNTKLYLYYDKNKSDNTNYVGDISSLPGQKVWSNGYKAVYHLCQNVVGTGNLKDSTNNNLNGTGINMDLAGVVSGRIGQATYFDGSNDYMTLPNFGMSGDVSITVDVFAKVDAGSANALTYFSFGSASQNQAFGFRTGDGAGSNGNSFVTFYSWNNDLVTSINSHYGSWCYFSAVYHSVSKIKYVYQNGVLKGSGTPNYTIAFTESNLNKIGSRMNLGEYFKGLMEDIWVSSIPRSDAWIKATYYSSWNELLTFDEIETPPVYTCSGVVNAGSSPLSDVVVCLHRRADGRLVDRTTTTSGGNFVLGSIYEEEHYIVALYTTSGTNALIYDWIAP